MLEKLKYRIKPLVEKSIVLQSLGQLAMVRLRLFLPHDADYIGLKQLVGKHPNRLFVDVGANQGTSALSYRVFDKSTPIVSIEANSLHRQALERIEKRDANFQFHLVACGAEPGELTLYTPRKRALLGDHLLHTMTSTDRDEMRQWIRSHYGKRFAASVSFDKVVAPVVALDSLELRPSILKIDTEGAELLVLRGAVETIASERPYILLEKAESNFESCQALLREHDYAACGYKVDDDVFHLSRFDGRNVYFVPRERLDEISTAGG